MKLSKIISWLDRTLEVDKFDDVSNNGLQVARCGEDVACVAFAVDASVNAIREAISARAQLLVVHHGISWGGGIKRIDGALYQVIRLALLHNIAIYACHLPLDAHAKYGNNFNLAKSLGLKRLKPAFSYHGNVIGVVGINENGDKVGVCSGGAGEFAETAKRLGCSLYITGEMNWGEEIAAQNVDMKVETIGHYESEIYGIAALEPALRRALKVKTKLILFKHKKIGERVEK